MSDITVTVQEDDLIGASTSLYNIPTINKLQDVGDIDVSNLNDGSVLVYSTNVSKWKSTIILEKQIVECGQY